MPAFRNATHSVDTLSAGRQNGIEEAQDMSTSGQKTSRSLLDLEGVNAIYRRGRVGKECYGFEKQEIERRQR